jgi:hypothetical protein
MAKWIQLTDGDGDAVYLNLDNALRIMPYGEENSLVGFPEAAGIHNVIVRESPAQVFEMAK